MNKKIKGKEEGYSVYSKMGDSISTTICETIEEAICLKSSMSIKGKMPYESFGDALGRYIVVKVIISYKEL